MPKKRRAIPKRQIVNPIIPSDEFLDKFRCQGRTAIIMHEINAIFLLSAFLKRKKSGKTMLLPISADGNLEENEFNPKIKEAAPERYIGITGG